MTLYVLIVNEYANLEYYDVCSEVIGIFDSEEKAINRLYSLIKEDFPNYNILYNEKNYCYELQDKNTKEIDEYSNWYSIENHQLNE